MPSHKAVPFKDKPEVRAALLKLYTEWPDSKEHVAEDMQAELTAVAAQFGVEQAEVELFFYKFCFYLEYPDSTATIYCSDLTATNPFDFSVNGIPCFGSVIGLVFANGSGQVVLPVMNTNQEGNLRKVLEEVLLLVGLLYHEWVPGPANGEFQTLVVQETAD